MTVIKDPSPKSKRSAAPDDRINNESIFGQHRFPFKSKLSFVPLIQFWEQELKSPHPTRALIARTIQALLEEAPALRKPITNPAILERHPELVDLLLSTLFPTAPNTNTLGRAFKPLDIRSIYRTTAFDEFMAQHPSYEFTLNKQPEVMFAHIVYAIYVMVLNRFYGCELDQSAIFNFSIEVTEGELPRHFKCHNNLYFLDILVQKPLPELSAAEIQQLLATPLDYEQWFAAIPPSHFEFQGIIAEELIDITAEISVSQLKNHLLDKDTFGGQQKMAELERSLRSFLGRSDLRLGLVATDQHGSLCLAHKYQIQYLLLSDEQENPFQQEGSVYHHLLQKKEHVVVQDLTLLEDPSMTEVELINQGYRSLVAFPLLNKAREVIGVLEVASRKINSLNELTAIRLREVIPLFETAMLRRRDETDNQIEAVIREKFTSLHPSVEWRFVESAYELWRRRLSRENEGAIDPIAFKRVYPFFAQSDIVSSTSLRNQAVQADLQDQLNTARELLLCCSTKRQLPVLDHYRYKLEQHIRGLKENFTSTKENRTVEFIRTDLHPRLRELQQLAPALEVNIVTYFETLDEKTALINKRRRAYEESVELINASLSTLLETEQQAAQEMMPHYFEKYKTDGIEFDMFAGQSLLQKGEFSNLQLQNLRIWQLRTLCKITRNAAQLRSQLPIPLETAQMIFVYGNPIDIRFRMDEKRFDVDGAYNIRYEVIKKRIDKAVVAGTNERLRSPGTISIVYTNDKDREEYMEYLQYFIAGGWIEDEIEELHLAKLQGVDGLKALRVSVAPAKP